MHVSFWATNAFFRNVLEENDPYSLHMNDNVFPHHVPIFYKYADSLETMPNDGMYTVDDFTNT